MTAQAGVSERVEPELLELTRSENGVAVRLRVSPELAYFAGHFPGFAILPGVVQIDWAMRFAQRYLALPDMPAQTLQVKFRKPVRPDTEIVLSLRLTAQGRRLGFECRDREGLCASGQIALGPP